MLPGLSGSRVRVRATRSKPAKCRGVGGRTAQDRQNAMCERAAEQRTPSPARENGGCQQLTSSAGVSRTAVVGSWDGQSRNTKHKSRTKRTVNIERGPALNLCAAFFPKPPTRHRTNTQTTPKAGRRRACSRYALRTTQQKPHLKQHALRE